MKNFLKISILSIVTIITFGSFTGVTLAQPAIPPLSVQFQNEPLFNEANFVPGNEVTRTVGVSNNSGTPQDIIVEAINAVDTGGLGDKLNLVIKEGDVSRYTGTLGAFLRAGEVSLSALSNGTNTTYSFGITFESDADNNLQNKTLGFDLCVGFQGGDKHCGDTVISDEGGGADDGGSGDTGGGTIPGTGGSGGSSGGGSGFPVAPIPLIISNEQANDNVVLETSTMVVTWNTNKLSTSQVVYGLVSEGPYTLDLNAANFGYPFATVDDPTKVMNHSMTLTGLVTGQTYLYRVVSRASPATVSFEHEFTVPVFALGTQINEQNNLFLQQQGVDETSGANTFSAGGVVGNSDGTGNTTSSSTGTSSEDTSDNSNQFATAFFGAGFLSWQFGLFLLLALLLILFIIWRRRKHDEDTPIN